MVTMAAINIRKTTTAVTEMGTIVPLPVCGLTIIKKIATIPKIADPNNSTTRVVLK